MVIPALIIWILCEIVATRIQRRALGALDDTSRLRLYDSFTKMRVLNMLPAAMIIFLVGVNLYSFYFPQVWVYAILPLFVASIFIRVYISRSAFRILRSLNLPDTFYMAQRRASIISVTGYILLNVVIILDPMFMTLV